MVLPIPSRSLDLDGTGSPSVSGHSTPIGAAAALDAAQAEHARVECLKAEAAYPRLLNLLRLARYALGPEYCYLAGQIDDELNGRTPLAEPEGELVLEQLPSGEHAWLRRAA